MPPWYQLVVVQFKPTSKLPYQKLPYPTYTKDIDHDAPTLEFSRRQLEPMARLWRLISLTYLVSLYKTTYWNGAKTLYKITPIAFLRSWNKHFVNTFKL